MGSWMWPTGFVPSQLLVLNISGFCNDATSYSHCQGFHSPLGAPWVKQFRVSELSIGRSWMVSTITTWGQESVLNLAKWPFCIGTYDTFLILRGKAQISTSFRDQVNQHAGICANPPATDSMGYQILPCNCCTEKHFQGDFCEAWLFFSRPGSWEKRWWTCLILEVVGVCRHYQGSLLIYVFMGFEIRWIPGFLVWFLCRQICGISSITGFARPS